MGAIKGRTRPNFQVAQKIESIMKDQDNSKSRDELAKIAGIGHTTYSAGVAILLGAPEEVKEMYRTGKIATYAAYTVMKMGKEQQKEFIKRTNKGENPIGVIRDIKHMVKNKTMNSIQISTRMSLADTRRIFDEMRSGVVPEFTIDDLIKDIRINADIYIEMLNSTLNDRIELVTIETESNIGAAIDYVIDKITEIRRRFK